MVDRASGHVLQRDLGGGHQGCVYVYVCVVIKLYLYNLYTLLYIDYVSVFKKSMVPFPPYFLGSLPGCLSLDSRLTGAW